jgi:nucleolar protein 53
VYVGQTDALATRITNHFSWFLGGAGLKFDEQILSFSRCPAPPSNNRRYRRNQSSYIFTFVTTTMAKKKTGAALRAKKRIQEATHELQEQQAAQAETAHVVNKPNEELFVLDTTAALVVPGLAADKKKGKGRKGLSRVDTGKINALLEKHDAKELQQIVKNNKARADRAKKRQKVIGNINANFDLWGGDSALTTTQKKKQKTMSTTAPGIGTSMAGTAPPAHVTLNKNQPAMPHQKKNKMLALQVAHSGQSYHPDTLQHEDVLGEALAVELRRTQVENYKNAPLSSGMSAKTKSLLLGDGDSSSEDEDGDEMVDEDELVSKKKVEKLTKAQRNKQKRHRALEMEIADRKKQKKLLNSVQNLKKWKKELTKEEQEQKERQQVLAQLKKDSERTLGHNVWERKSSKRFDAPLHVPTLPVALRGELQSSLRSVQPKGSLLQDRMESLCDRNMTTTKQRGGDKRTIVQGKKRKRKVKGNHEYKVDGGGGGGSDFVLMG